jgi:hypothetical protein
MLAGSLVAQGLDTNATKEDWEEINFEFNSSVLVDGYPSLLRLADLLKTNPSWKLRVIGHTDHIGGDRSNERLGLARANTVKNFLVKYGAGANQIEVASKGEGDPRTQPKRRGYSRTDEGRWMNRRVSFELVGETGQRVNALVTPPPQLGIADLLKKLDSMSAAQEKCCSEILKRLDRLDEIAAMLQKLTGLEGRIQALEKQNQALQDALGQRPTSAQVSEITSKTATEALERERLPRYNTLNANIGGDSNGNVTFTGRGRYFHPFRERFAFQAQGEYMYFRDRQEGEIDFGFVNRFSTRVQAGLFSSFKNVNFSGEDPGRNIFSDRPATQFDPGQMRGNGTLGQASMTIDYLFKRGRIGVFGAKGFLNEAVLNRVALSRNVFNEYYLRTVDQVGASALVGLMGDAYVEGNLGYLKSRGNADRPGGTVRFVFPFASRLAFTVEGGLNETLVGRDNNGRVVAGLQFGNFMRPKDYLAGFNGIEHAVPVDIPRVRYEVLTRRVRTGNDAPIADAGPDQIGVPAGQVVLDGSASFDPDGDPITYQWTQVAGNSVALSGANTSRATFTAGEGQSYSFRLTVKDDKNAQSIARTTVTTQQPAQVRILRFQANPNVIDLGQSSTLTWQVDNAESVEIVGVGNVNNTSGTSQVSPQNTTTYTLVARNRNGEVRESATVTVRRPEVRFLTCTAQPMNIMAGESATLFYAATGADEVTISGIGSVGASGTQTVSPAQSTTYTLTARNSQSSAQTTCSVTVQVTPGEVPRILRFTANPTQITSGQASTLLWAVENATSLRISSVGTVQSTGTQDVRPTQTTIYTLTATNRFGDATASATVTVTQEPPVPPNAPALAACSANPGVSARPGDPVQLRYTSTNATSVTISQVANPPLQGPVTVNPLTTTVYTVTATGANNQTATCQITAQVTPVKPPTPIITGPSVVETLQRQITLDASQSVDPQGLPLTYIWTPLSTGAAVLDQGQVQTRVQFGGLAGDYIFQLTVTNSAGQSASTTVTVRFRRVTFP